MSNELSGSSKVTSLMIAGSMARSLELLAVTDPLSMAKFSKVNVLSAKLLSIGFVDRGLRTSEILKARFYFGLQKAFGPQGSLIMIDLNNPEG